MLLNRKRLESLNACKDAIKFLENNDLLPLDLDKIKITGEYENYYSWFKNLDIKKIEFDKNDNLIYFENSYGYWYKQEFDKNDNLIYHEKSDGYWFKQDFDSNNNLIYCKYSYGYWYKQEFDSNNNLIYLENSYRSWFKREFNSNNNLIYFENSYGYWYKQEFIKTEKEFIIIRNDKEICRIDFLK